MHPSAMNFVKGALAGYHPPQGLRVIEVGSYDVNGSVREWLEPLSSEYVGVDIREGPGVDHVTHERGGLPHEWGELFNLYVSTETFEHCRYPWRLAREAYRVLRSGGLAVVTARGYYADLESGATECTTIHDYPNDFWRYGQGALSAVFEDAGFTVLSELRDPDYPGFFLAAVK